MNRVPLDWPNRQHSRMVRSGGIEWHVQMHGNGPTLLLIHGTGAATHSWRDILPLAASHFRVIAIDLPGHGFTIGRPSAGLTLPAMARSLGALMKDMEFAPAMIAGHSAGAAIAIRMVLDGHAKPGALIGLAPALLPFPGVAQFIFPTMAKLLFVNPFAPQIFAQIARGRGSVGRFLERSTGSRIDALGTAAYAQLFGRSAHCAGTIAMMADWDLDPLARALPSLTTPLLIVHGERDKAIPLSAAREVVALVLGAELAEIPNLGHLVHEEAPEAAMALLLAFARTHAILEA